MSNTKLGIGLSPGDWVKITSISMMISVPEPISIDINDGKSSPGDPLTIINTTPGTYAKFIGRWGHNLVFKLEGGEYHVEEWNFKFTRVSKKEYRSLEVLYGG